VKKVLAILIFVMPIFVLATPLQLNFNRASVQTFLGTLYGDVLRKSYVLSPDVLAMTRAVTLNVSVEPDKLNAFVEGFMADQGLSVVDRDGVLYVGLRMSTSSASAVLSAPLPVAVTSSVPFAPGLARAEASAPVSTESLPPAFRVFKPSKTTPKLICESVNMVFVNSCHATASAVLLTHPKYLETLAELVEKLDSRPALVDVSVTFVEVTGSKRDGFGLNLVASVLGGSVGLNLGAAADTSTLTIKGANITALLDILRSDGRFKQVANPSGRVLSGEAFNIAIGDDVPTLSGQSRDQTGQVTSQVIYRPSGVLLNVTPTAITENDHSLVATSVDAQVSSFSKTESGVNGSPTLSKRQVKTSLMLADGEVAVLGGLTGSRSVSSSSSLFGVTLANRDDDTSTDLLLLLSARVVK
jgi:type II secretory pathway component GspD/PulD (secretin)